MSLRIKKVFWYVLITGLIGLGAYVFKVAWYERYVWPDDVESMQDLPPIDRSGWPDKPVSWRVEKQEVEVATPQGIETREITYYVNSLGMDFVRIEPGSFYQEGGILDTLDAKRLRRKTDWFEPGAEVTLTRPYFMAAFEITNALYEQFDPDHVSQRPKYQRGTKGDLHPVEPVGWRDAQRFARWLSQREGRLYRLPTEAEWEYAAKAGTTTRLYWGTAFWDRTKANLGGRHSSRESYREDLFKQTAPVGVFPANPWGLYDMVGNSYEWVQDWWHDVVPGTTVVDPVGPSEGHYRMGKGGGWTTRPYAIFTGERDGNNPADIRDARGFRLMVEIEG